VHNNGLKSNNNEDYTVSRAHKIKPENDKRLLNVIIINELIKVA